MTATGQFLLALDSRRPRGVRCQSARSCDKARPGGAHHRAHASRGTSSPPTASLILISFRNRDVMSNRRERWPALPSKRTRLLLGGGIALALIGGMGGLSVAEASIPAANGTISL